MFVTSVKIHACLQVQKLKMFIVQLGKKMLRVHFYFHEKLLSIGSVLIFAIDKS